MGFTMGRVISIHPENPQARLLKDVAEVLAKGGVIAYPTESGYALGCTLDNKEGAERIRSLRQLPKDFDFTLMCRDLKHLSEYARVDNTQFRFLKSHVPGAYTFVLEASREVPKRLQNPKRKTIGLRITPNIITQELLCHLQQPLMSTSFIVNGELHPQSDPWEIEEIYGNQLDLIVDGGYPGHEPTTVVDLTDASFPALRLGQGVVDWE